MRGPLGPVPHAPEFRSTRSQCACRGSSRRGYCQTMPWGAWWVRRGIATTHLGPLRSVAHHVLDRGTPIQGWGGGLVWFGSTPPPDDQAHGQRNRPCATRLGWALPAVAVSRRAGLLTAPEPRGGTRGREIPPCLCVWCARRWGAFGSGGGGGRCVCGAVCRLVLQAPAGRQWAPDAKPAGGVIGLDTPPPGQLTCRWPALLDCVGTGGVAQG